MVYIEISDSVQFFIEKYCTQLIHELVYTWEYMISAFFHGFNENFMK